MTDNNSSTNDGTQSNPSRDGRSHQTNSNRRNINGRTSTRYTQSKSGSSSSPFKVINHSIAVITTRYYNTSFIARPFREITDEVIDISYKIDPIKSRLDKQAQVFARKVISMEELDLRHALNQYPERWQSMLEQTFVYSYFKCLLYGTSNSRIAELPEDFFCILGHGIMYHIINKHSFSFEHNGIGVVYTHECSETHYESLLALARQYSFLNNCITSEGSRFYMENEYYDRYLRKLSKELKGTRGPHLIEMLNSQNIARHLTQDSFPVLNSFYTNEKNENKWRYSFAPPAKLHDNGMLFGKAIFATQINSTNSNYDYFTLINESDDNSLVKYEVTAIAGSNYPNYIKGGNNPK
jgi:hypothetical protein